MRVLVNTLAVIGAFVILGGAAVALLSLIDRSIAAPKHPVSMTCYPRYTK